jgi:phosphate transport system protein
LLVRDAFTAQLAELESLLEGELECAGRLFADITYPIQIPSAAKTQEIADQGERLRTAGRAVDADLVIVTARQAPVGGDLRLVLALIELAYHTMLIANQLELIADQLGDIEADPPLDRVGTAGVVDSMMHLAGSQLLHAVRTFASRDLATSRRINVEDDQIDRLNRDVFDAALALDDVPEQRACAMRHVLIARSLERIADNAVDIAEELTFLMTAERTALTDASRCGSRAHHEPSADA